MSIYEVIAIGIICFISGYGVAYGQVLELQKSALDALELCDKIIAEHEKKEAVW